MVKETNENWLAHDHQAYVRLGQELETLVRAAEWHAGYDKLVHLYNLMQTHISFEERVLFPAYENLVGMRDLKTRELRREHKHLRNCLGRLACYLNTRALPAVLHETHELASLMAAHHENEEQTFFPVASRVLLKQREEVLARLSHDKGVHLTRGEDRCQLP